MIETTGDPQRSISSLFSVQNTARRRYASVCSNSLLPQICNAGPSDAFSLRTSSTASPPMCCEFSQSKRSRLRVTTYFVALLEMKNPWLGGANS